MSASAAGFRGQDSGVRGQGPVVGFRHRCEVENCDNRASWRVYCDECQEQIDALDAMFHLGERRRARRRAWRARVLAGLRRRLWMIEAAAVAIGVAYVMTAFAAAWIGWLL